MTTVKQEAHRMNQKLDKIWRMGDRDECSVKHIGWATTALAYSEDWTDGLDYPRPWSVWGSGDEKALADQWAKVTEVRDRCGLVTFADIMRSTKFEHYFVRYYEEYGLFLVQGDLEFVMERPIPGAYQIQESE